MKSLLGSHPPFSLSRCAFPLTQRPTYALFTVNPLWPSTPTTVISYHPNAFLFSVFADSLWVTAGCIRVLVRPSSGSAIYGLRPRLCAALTAQFAYASDCICASAPLHGRLRSPRLCAVLATRLSLLSDPGYFLGSLGSTVHAATLSLRARRDLVAVEVHLA